jgi:2-oxoglutarate dehydrogenase E2 component (dihydrolipoamide succinyltransferase)
VAEAAAEGGGAPGEGGAEPAPLPGAAAAAAEGAEVAQAAPLQPPPPTAEQRAAAEAAAALSAGGAAKLTTKEWAALKNARQSGRLAASGAADGGAPVEHLLAATGWNKAFDAAGVARFVHGGSGRAVGSVAELLAELGAAPPGGAAAGAAAAAVPAPAPAPAPEPPAPDKIPGPAPAPALGKEAALAKDAKLGQLPQGWVAQWSTSKTRVYYFNESSKASAWTREKIPRG